MNLNDSRGSIPEYVNIPKPVMVSPSRGHQTIQEILSNTDKIVYYDDLIKKQQEQSDASKQQQQAFGGFGFLNPYLIYGMPINLQELLGMNIQFPQKIECIGLLTKEERRQKVENYLEKKKNRNFRQIRYKTRKDLADNRERIHGRFVKNQKPRFTLDIFDKSFQKNLQKEAQKIKTMENSSWPGFAKDDADAENEALARQKLNLSTNFQ